MKKKTGVMVFIFFQMLTAMLSLVVLFMVGDALGIGFKVVVATIDVIIILFWLLILHYIRTGGEQNGGDV